MCERETAVRVKYKMRLEYFIRAWSTDGWRKSVVLFRKGSGMENWNTGRSVWHSKLLLLTPQTFYNWYQSNINVCSTPQSVHPTVLNNFAAVCMHAEKVVFQFLSVLMQQK